MCEPGHRDNGASDVWALTAYSMRASKSLLENIQGPKASPAGPRSYGTARFAKVSPVALIYNSFANKNITIYFYFVLPVSSRKQVSSG